MSRSGSVEVRPRWNDRSESEQAQTLRHSDEIRLGDRVGRINSIRLDFAGLRAKLLGVGTCQIQRRVNHYAHAHALLDRVGEGMETASHLQVSRAGRRLCRVDGYERHKVAHRFRQQRCHTCNACLATHALHVWHARPECLAKHASHAVIAPSFSAQKAAYLRKSSFSVK